MILKNVQPEDLRKLDHDDIWKFLNNHDWYRSYGVTTKRDCLPEFVAYQETQVDNAKLILWIISYARNRGVWVPFYQKELHEFILATDSSCPKLTQTNFTTALRKLIRHMVRVHLLNRVRPKPSLRVSGKFLRHMKQVLEHKEERERKFHVQESVKFLNVRIIGFQKRKVQSAEDLKVWT